MVLKFVVQQHQASYNFYHAAVAASDHDAAGHFDADHFHDSGQYCWR